MIAAKPANLGLSENRHNQNRRHQETFIRWFKSCSCSSCEKSLVT